MELWHDYTFSFILLNSEKNELRSSGSYRAIRLVATVAVGVCGTRSARTVLALFPPSLLRLRRPIKAESGDLACILTPSLLLSLRVFLPLRPYGPLPYILRYKTPRRATGHGRGEGEMYSAFALAPIL